METCQVADSSPTKRQRKTAVVSLLQKVDVVPDNHDDVPYADGSEHSENSDEEADKVAENGISRLTAPEPGALTAKFRRRNSISLPAGLDALLELPEEKRAKMKGDKEISPVSKTDLEAITEANTKGEGASDGESNSGGSCSDDESSYSASDEENISVKMPLRSSRKKSVMPLPKLRLNDTELPDEFLDRGFSGMESPGNSVTSINSLSSLLKEKLVMTFPGVLRRKRPREYKLKAFVAILFLCIVFLVGFAYIFYHQQVLQRAYFERIRFNKDERQMKVYGADGQELISGVLGVGLGGRSYPCLARDNPGNGSVCLEWMRYARLVMRYDEFADDVRCYHITWQSLSHQHHPTDCFDWSFSKGHWFGGGLASGGAWPLEKGHVRMAPFVTGSVPGQSWANVLQRYFLNSQGAAILIDDDSPLYVDLNSTMASKFCIKAKHDDFAYVYHKTDMPQLNYSVCTAPDVKQLHSFLAESSLWDGIKESDEQIINSLLTEPIWQIPANNPDQLTEQEVANLTEEVVSLGYPAGPVLLNEFWQSSAGDLVLDESRFPTFKDTVDIIHRRGFRVVLTVQPFISTESNNFYEAVREGLLVNERGGEIPALTRYKNFLSAGVVDITKNHSILWLQQKLKSLQQQHSIDSFYLDMGSAYDMPRYYQFDQQLTNPDQFKTQLTKRIQQSVPLLGVSGAIQRPQPPTFVSLPPFASDWRSLNTIIPALLTYGIMGYPFLLAGPVGGECEITSNLPERELYIRWMQLAAFLPTLSFKHLPSRYDAEVEKIAKGLLELRQTLVNPLLTKSIDEALNNGIPFARPLWMLEPLGQAAQSVDDEFSIGDQIIVAPVLQQNSEEREVYLPNGVWKDGIDGSLRKGNRWIHHYRVPLDKVAYFLRMPNNTRF
ncbi:myogenesis-regulating glycosidase isoform X1 [Neocloeon triangulifer]|uniref:myogenesis-regulating glycosidase isoform X1 n=1 Tax=Neocloeon triangulifer TaxID=2078957 RepID=UPI00286F56AC|nr:myogenesis-regulating glycosidase isoform X1 [Neocloeon triangulifer]